jgi:hypothetical protein
MKMCPEESAVNDEDKDDKVVDDSVEEVNMVREYDDLQIRAA